ncbi:MAG TPA: hypothetical protein VFM51_09315 [Solirubrobacterales bacterium]|nr:hypothetical protein [Solirubrobacterales bacterium]
MRTLKMIRLAAMMTLAVTALMGADSASATTTTLEVGGFKKNESVEIEASLKTGTDTTFQLTTGAHFDTCTGSEIKVATESPYSGITGPVGGEVSTLTISNCVRKAEVFSPGTLTIERIPGTTDGTVVSSGAEWKVSGTICKTGEGTDLGILTGVASGHATLHVNVVVNCGFSVVMKGTYTITSPTGLGVDE